VRRFLVSTAAGLWLVPLLGLASAHSAEPSKKTESSCGNHGTSVEFVGTPSEAARQAKKQEKLVFVLHVSGHFEDSSLT
jgi:hypothetical protein